MAKIKIAITMKKDILEDIDGLVQDRTFANRSQAIGAAAQAMIERHRKTRLGRECRKLDKAAEQRLAEEGWSRDIEEWPEY
jgi:metal-responsive CopG/Arc/MetJ family transcriptional regulator